MTGVRAWRAGAALLVLLVLGQQVVGDGPLTRLDRAVEDWLVPRRDNAWGALARLLTALGAPSTVVPLLVLLAVLLAVRRRSPRTALQVAAALVALGVSVLVLKDVIGRPSPHGGSTHGGAWPSGHTATATVVWGCVVRLLPVRRRVAALLDTGLPLLVAVCLVVGGYHQVTDVVAGYALGVLLLELVWPQATLRAATARASPVREGAGSAP